MNYVGIDIHKKYSVLCAQDEQGRKIPESENRCAIHECLVCIRNIP